MRSGPIIHGVLLVLALLFAYQTTTRKEEVPSRTGTEVVWDKGTVSVMSFQSKKKKIRISQKGQGAETYLWGVVEKLGTKSPIPKSQDTKETQDPTEPKNSTEVQAETEKPKETQDPVEDQKSPKETVDSAAPKGKEDPAIDEVLEVVSIREFPVSESGEEFIASFGQLKALRSLGTLNSQDLERYMLKEDPWRLEIEFSSKETRVLLIASKTIYGGADRYALDESSGKGYVLSGKLSSQLERMETNFALRKVHRFKDSEVESIAVTTSAGDKELWRRSADTPKATNGKPSIAQWAEGTAGEADIALSTFVDRVSKLRPVSFEPELSQESLKHIATLRYRDAQAAAIGYLELYRWSSDAVKPHEYVIKSERTQVVAKVGRLGGEQVDGDLLELFGVAAAEPKKAPSLAPTTEAQPKATEAPTSTPKATEAQPKAPASTPKATAQ